MDQGIGNGQGATNDGGVRDKCHGHDDGGRCKVERGEETTLFLGSVFGLLAYSKKKRKSEGVMEKDNPGSRAWFVPT